MHTQSLPIETGDICIDATGHYDEFGTLKGVEIDGKVIVPFAVKLALTYIGHSDYTRWADDIELPHDA